MSRNLGRAAVGALFAAGVVLGPGAAIGQDSDVERARGEVAAMDTTRERIYREFAVARDQRDIVKSLCLDDKVNQMDTTLRTAGERLKAFEQASRLGDREGANHERMMLNVLGERARAIDLEARACVDKKSLEKGDVPAGGDGGYLEPPLPGEEVTVSFPVAPVVIEPPACASCFR